MMRLAGRLTESGGYWAVEVPILAVVTQGRTKKEALEMIADAIESLINKEGFKIDVFTGVNCHFEIGSQDAAALTAFLLRRHRMRYGLTLEDVKKRLGTKSLNAYARYEQGKSVPTIVKLNQLLRAVTPDKDFVISEGLEIRE